MIVLRIIAVILILIGVIFCYDARVLTENWFSYGDQNEATKGLKILGFLIAIIGAFIIYFI